MKPEFVCETHKKPRCNRWLREVVAVTSLSTRAFGSFLLALFITLIRDDGLSRSWQRCFMLFFLFFSTLCLVVECSWSVCWSSWSDWWWSWWYAAVFSIRFTRNIKLVVVPSSSSCLLSQMVSERFNGHVQAATTVSDLPPWVALTNLGQLMMILMMSFFRAVTVHVQILFVPSLSSLWWCTACLCWTGPFDPSAFTRGATNRVFIRLLFLFFFPIVVVQVALRRLRDQRKKPKRNQ